MNHRTTCGLPPRTARVATLAGLSLLLLAACGGDAGDGSAETASPAAAENTDGGEAGDDTFPVTVASGEVGAETELTIEARPEAIVSLSPTATEMLWAVGAGDQVVAVDDQSDYPEGVPTTDLSGFEPNIEAILGYSPDLVVTASDTGDLVTGLASAGVPTLVLPAAGAIEDSYDQIERVGAATGNVAGSAEVVAGMSEDIEQILAGVPQREEPLAYYHELSPDYYTVTDDTFIGDVYGRLGLRSIATDDGQSGGYPQLSPEAVVQADPDVVFLADIAEETGYGITVEDVLARPGWDQIAAVRNDAVTPVDPDIASRWGPRVVDFLRIAADAVTAVPEGVPAS